MNEVNAIDYWYQKYLKEKLTWEDIEKIVDLYEDVYCDFSISEMAAYTGRKEHYEEVLKRFNELRKK